MSSSILIMKIIIMEQHNSISGIFKITKICWIFRLCATTDSLISEPVIFFLLTRLLVYVLLCPIWKPQSVMKILWDNSAKIFVWKKYQPTYMWIKDNVRKVAIMWYNYRLFLIHVLYLQNKPKYCWVLARQIYIGVNWFMKSHSDFHKPAVSDDRELLY